jgi:hypothetical protein
MTITRKALPRRTILRGAGATIALPLLDAMVPALTAQSRTAAAGVPRLGFFYTPNGVYPEHYHPKGNGGTDFELTPILMPLKDLRPHWNVLSGLSNRGALSHDEGGGVHSRAHAPWLNGVRPKRTEGADISVGKTIDQYAADKFSAETSLRSLELTTESAFQVGSCEQGYSCAYWNSTSWRAPNRPNLHEHDPRAVFERLFGDGGSPEVRLAQMKKDRSILDSASESMKRLQRELSPADQQTVGEYLDSVREIEQRIQRAERTSASSPIPVAQPDGVPDEFDDHVKLLMDLLVLAYQGDITRVSCMQFAREQTNRNYPHIGVRESHHGCSHHQHRQSNVDAYTKICAYHAGLVARFLEKLKGIPEGDRTLLDNVVIVWGAGMGDGDTHAPLNLPVVVAGGAGGQLKGGRHIVYPMDTPFMNFGITVLQKVGVTVDRIGDSTGLLTNL